MCGVCAPFLEGARHAGGRGPVEETFPFTGGARFHHQPFHARAQDSVGYGILCAAKAARMRAMGFRSVIDTATPNGPSASKKNTNHSAVGRGDEHGDGGVRDVIGRGQDPRTILIGGQPVIHGQACRRGVWKRMGA